MSSNSQLFRCSARSVEAGWTRWKFRDKSGKRCMVQVLLDELGLNAYLPEDVLNELHTELSARDDYLNMVAACAVYGITDVQTCVMAWNDQFWRSQKDVVAVLDAIANRLERTEHEQAELSRIKSERIQTQVDFQTIVAYQSFLAEKPQLVSIS